MPPRTLHQPTGDLERFSLPGLAFLPGRHHLPVADVQTPQAQARLYLHGATLTDYQPADHKPVLFTSRAAYFDGRKAIRGGVPICFPWFSSHPTDPDAPAHGLVRTKPWQVTASDQTPQGLRLELATNLDHLHGAYHLTVGPALHLRFIASNKTDQPQRFELALHTYLAVGDIRRVSITGLENTDYLDNLDHRARKQQDASPITFDREIDRVYVNTDAPATLDDPAWGRRLVVEKRGASSTVVWNPWIEKAKHLADLGDEEYEKFCCIETGCIAENAIELPPGGSHTVDVTVRVG
jgi:glucose-6-phosphate 1-epimerase